MKILSKSMNYYQQIERIRRIDRLIQMKATGPPWKLAQQLGVSEATVYRYLSNFKEMGADIKYCHSKGSYIYMQEFKLRF